ncbi:hypothetical protein U9M48_034082 [Paspalum notatum var. saurae]|uniref:Uncharacterized protein n=1 Tax=Paspalum notatum var. saurae TaxID=547442 RepID=A0AAQ3X7I5_PASNO
MRYTDVINLDTKAHACSSSGGAKHPSSSSMAVHMLLVAVPAVAAGFMQSFQLAFLLWPFNLALPLARDLPRACITLRGIASFYAAGLRGYADGARRGVQLLQARRSQQHQEEGDDSSLHHRTVARTREEAVAQAMFAFDDIF